MAVDKEKKNLSAALQQNAPLLFYHWFYYKENKTVLFSLLPIFNGQFIELLDCN